MATQTDKPRRYAWLTGIAGKFATIVGAVVIVCGFVALTVVAAKAIFSRKPPGPVVIELRLDRELAEDVAGDPLAAALSPDRTSLHKVIEALDRGAQDKDVAGLIAYMGTHNHGLAAAYELREAIARFRKAGKYAHVFSPSFGEGGSAIVSYYLASAFDEIWMQPSGNLGLAGLAAEVPFVRGTFDKLGIVPQGEQRKEYKNAIDTFLQTEFTEAHREATRALLENLSEEFIAAIASARKLDPQTVRTLLAEGPLPSRIALESKLIDHLGYRDEAVATAKKRGGAEARLQYELPYLDDAGRLYDEGDKIALVFGVGAIVQGTGSIDPLSGGGSMGAETVSAALRRALDDEDVKAIVFRVSSPGGSYIASDTVWREVERARQMKKPVIVSMGDMAASGGYFVSMNATKIYADPGTLTGSIGVYALKLVTRDMWNKLGITFGTLATTENADMWSSLTPFDETELKRLRGWLDFVYEDFTTKAAKGRGQPIEKLEPNARGRVWTGRQAKDLGLVDEIGGLHAAITGAKEAAGLKADAPIKLVKLPEREGLLERLLGDKDESSEPQDVQVRIGLLERLRQVESRLNEVGLDVDATGGDGVLVMPPLNLGR